ncbi:MAG: helix-turn-helix domain-containing protein [Rhizobiaceae bacterium]
MASRSPIAHADRVQSALRRNASAKSAVVASWERSAGLHRLDPEAHRPTLRITEQELREARQRIEPLVRASQASLDRLYLAIGNAGYCVLLCDRNGVPLERRGAARDDGTFNKRGLWTGAVWSEEAEGTNGIGTCLVEQRALTIHRDQHFFSRNTQFSCTTAPIYDHEGKLAAALDVSCCRADVTESFVSLIQVAVGDAVRRIEAENFRLAFPGARVMLAPTADNSPAALIAVDRDDLVIGATRAARLSLGLTPDAMTKPLPAWDVLGVQGRVGDDLDHAERGALQRALARAGGNVSAAAKLLGISRATLHRKLNRFDLGKTN